MSETTALLQLRALTRNTIAALRAGNDDEAIRLGQEINKFCFERCDDLPDFNEAEVLAIGKLNVFYASKLSEILDGMVSRLLSEPTT